MIELVIGRQGSGKTLFLVKRGFEAYRQGKTIYSNVDLTFPYKQLDYQDVIDCNLKDAVALQKIFNAWRLFESCRTSYSRFNT